MSERLIALADAAEAVCRDCRGQNGCRAALQDDDNGRPMHYRYGGERGRFCKAWGVRKLVGKELEWWETDSWRKHP